jgi:O-antigen/teichoic acid export membrane protein
VLRRGWPLIGHSLLGLVIFNADFLFLRALRGTAAVGLYASAYTLISFLLNLGVAYGFSLLPALTRAGSERGGAARQPLYDGALAQVFAVSLPLAVGGSLLAPGLVGLVFGDGYLAAAAPLRVLLWSIPVALFRTVSQAALVAAGRQHDVMISAMWSAGLSIVLNIILIPPLGLVGAATATLATETVRTLLVMRYASATGLGLPGARRFWRALLAAAAMAGVVFALSGGHVLVAIAAGAAAYGVILAATGGLALSGGVQLRV